MSNTATENILDFKQTIIGNLPNVKSPGGHRLGFWSILKSNSYNSGHSPDVAVDLGVCQELGGKITVESDLNTGRGMNPEARVEQAVIKKLLEQEITVVGGTGDEILGQLEEGVEEVGGEVLPAGLGEEVGDDKEASAGNDLLLDAGAALYQ